MPLADLPLPDPSAPTEEVRWAVDAGLFFPSAMPAEQGDVEVLVGPCGNADSVGFDLGASASPVDRLELGFRATVPVVSFSHVSALTDADTRVYDALYYLYVRYNVVDLPAVRVSPWVGFGRYSVDDHVQLAVAVDTGLPWLRFDGSLSLLHAETYGTKGDVQTASDFDRQWGLNLPPYIWRSVGWEAGLRWLPHRRNAVRIGYLPGAGVALGWRWQGEHLEAAADVVGRYISQVPRIQAHVGYRF